MYDEGLAGSWQARVMEKSIGLSKVAIFEIAGLDGMR
jgi:hypothetical protein